MSYDEFLAFVEGDVRAEWVNGEVTVFVSNSRRHQLVHAFLVTLLTWFARRQQMGEVIAPFAMRVAELGWVREPDILFVAQQHLDRVGEMRLVGPADLVVEIVSDESVSRDTREKRGAYQDAGVPEYWLLDSRPGHERATFLHLDDNGVYREATLDERGRYRSAVLPGFWIDPEWLWLDPLPEPDELKPIILGESNPVDAGR